MGPVKSELMLQEVKAEYITDESRIIQGKELNLVYNRVIWGDNLVFLEDYKETNQGTGIAIIDPPRMHHLGKTQDEQLGYLRTRIQLAWDVLDEGGYMVVMVDIEDSHHMRYLLDDILTGTYTLKMHVIRKVDGYDKVIYIQKGVDTKKEIDQEVVFLNGEELLDITTILNKVDAPFIPVKLTRSIVQYYRDYCPEIWGVLSQYDLRYLEPFIMPLEVADLIPEGDVRVHSNADSQRLILKKDGKVYKLKDKPFVREDLKLELMYNEIFDNERYDYVEGKKPLSLVKNIIRYMGTQAYKVLDIFAGTGTTAQAVMELNNEDGGKREFILVEKENPFTIIYPRLKHLEDNGKAQNCVFQTIV